MMKMEPEQKKAAAKGSWDLGTAFTGGGAGGMIFGWIQDLLEGEATAEVKITGLVVFGVLVLASMFFAFMGRRGE